MNGRTCFFLNRRAFRIAFASNHSRRVCQRYQTWRRFEDTALALGFDAVNRLFSNDNPLLRGIRDAGMAMVGEIAPARRFFMKQAAGLSGPLPRLMEGRRI